MSPPFFRLWWMKWWRWMPEQKAVGGSGRTSRGCLWNKRYKNVFFVFCLFDFFFWRFLKKLLTLYLSVNTIYNKASMSRYTHTSFDDCFVMGIVSNNGYKTHYIGEDGDLVVFFFNIPTLTYLYTQLDPEYSLAKSKPTLGIFLLAYPRTEVCPLQFYRLQTASHQLVVWDSLHALEPVLPVGLPCPRGWGLMPTCNDVLSWLNLDSFRNKSVVTFLATAKWQWQRSQPKVTRHIVSTLLFYLS